jgi:hypothetical protein
METRNRGTLVVAIALIVAGIWLLALQVLPSLGVRIDEPLGWALGAIGIGVLLLLIGLATQKPGLAIPACIVGGIGGLLYWQGLTGRWETWAYAWALIPGFAGVGTILVGVLEGRGRTAWAGVYQVFVSLVLFAIFASFLGGFQFLGAYWPVMVIGLGVLLLLRAGLGRR